MAFSLLQSKAAAGSTSNASVTLDNAPIPGSLLCAIIAINQPTSGIFFESNYIFTINRPYSSNTWGLRLYVKVTEPGDDATLQFTNNAATWEACAFEFDGPEQFQTGTTWTTFDAASTGNTGNGVSTIQPGSLTPAGLNELMIAAVGLVASNGGGETVGSGFTLIESGALSLLMVAYKVKTDAAAENPTFNWTTARQVGSAQAAFKASLPNRNLWVPPTALHQAASW